MNNYRKSIYMAEIKKLEKENEQLESWKRGCARSRIHGIDLQIKRNNELISKYQKITLCKTQ